MSALHKSALISVVFGFLQLPLFAASEKEFASAINIAGRQRMLTQKMAKESLFIVLDVNKQQNQKNRDKTIQLFETSLRHLISGSAESNIPKPPNDAVLAKLEAVNKDWPAYKKAVLGTSAAEISKLSTPILKKMNKAVKEYERAFFKAGFKGSGKTINIAGRQRMLTQKMAKEVLLIASKAEVDKNSDALGKSISLFDMSLDALLNGSKQMRIDKASNPEISKQLMVVQGKWKSYKSLLSSKDTSKKALMALDKESPVILSEMNKAVGMYEKTVK